MEPQRFGLFHQYLKISGERTSHPLTNQYLLWSSWGSILKMEDRNSKKNLQEILKRIKQETCAGMKATAFLYRALSQTFLGYIAINSLAEYIYIEHLLYDRHLGKMVHKTGSLPS